MPPLTNMMVDIFRGLFSRPREAGPNIAALLGKSHAPRQEAEFVFKMLIVGHGETLGGLYEGARDRLPEKLKKLSDSEKSWLTVGTVPDIKSVITRCLNAGASIDFIDTENRASLMNAVLDARRPELLEFLISRKASVDAISVPGEDDDFKINAPLVNAVRAFQTGEDPKQSAAARLIEAGADPNGCDVYGISGLGYAVNLNDLDLADYLVSKGARPMHIDNSGGTMMHDLFEQMEDFPEETVDWMIANGVDPEHRNNEGDSVYDVIDIHWDTEGEALKTMVRAAVAKHQAASLSAATVPAPKRSSGLRL